ncbi:MAG: 3-deoxy-manno-octulosonate cytidylyltransferase [Thermodesulfobacteriota bacterium]
MANIPHCYGIIPTRYVSSRFKGKPLAPILGKPMIWHVYTRACLCPLMEKVILATDSEKIYSVAKSLDIPVLTTSSDHTCGTERVLEAASIIGVPDNGIVLNIQGDEPALVPEMLTELVSLFSFPEVLVSTIAHSIDNSEAENPDQVKVVVGRDGRALYFSRSLIPYPRDGKPGGFYGHIGIYGFRMKVLRKFAELDKGFLEKKEKLEQLRLLENGIPINVVKTSHKGYGVDRPEDIALVEQILGGE